MKRFKNILFLYNGEIGSEAALVRAQALARSNGARLTLLEVVQHVPSDLVALLGGTPLDQPEIEARYMEERRALLERVAVSIRQDGVPAEIKVLRGKAFLETIRTVLRDGHDLIVMIADSVKGLRNITFGSTSMHLMRKCPCPVWVMKPKAGSRFRRILAAVDPPVDGKANSPLDVKIVQLATSLSHMEGCELDVVHAWDLVGPDLETSRSENTERMLTDLLERNRSAHEEAVERLLAESGLNGTQPRIRLLRGEPWSIVPRFARQHAVDLIVMGTVTRTGIAGFLIGDTAEHVLQQVDCSVLAVKPEGFQTPITLES